LTSACETWTLLAAEIKTSGGSRLGPEGQRPPNLAQAPKFLIGSIVISLSRCCLPNDEEPAPHPQKIQKPPLIKKAGYANAK